MLAFGFLLIGEYVYAQTDTRKIIDSTELRKERQNTLAKSLSFLSSSNSFTSLGNFAAVSTDEKTIKASIFWLNKHFNMNTLTVQTGATEGIGTLFDEGSQESNVGIGFEHRILLQENKKPYVSTGKVELNKITNQRRDLYDAYMDSIASFSKRLSILDETMLERRERIIKVENDTIIETFLKSEEILKKILPKEYSRLQRIEYAIGSFPNTFLVDSIKNNLVNQKDSLCKRIEKKLEAIVSDKLGAFDDAFNEGNKSLIEKEKALKSKLFNLEFLSIGFNANNKGFKFFDSTMVSSKQVAKRDFTTLTFGLGYTSVRNIRVTKRDSLGLVADFEPNKLRFFSIGTKFELTDNLTSLSDVEVQDTKFLDMPNERNVISTEKAKFGDYKEDLKSLVFEADYYQFFSYQSNSIALHLNPRHTIKDSSKPLTEFQIGLLFPFKKKDEEKTIVNIEVFYQLKDVFDTLDKFEDGFFKRNIIGIQTSFPFNFNF